jgi:hypothetical protein
VAHTTVAADLDQPLDVHGHFSAQITFHLESLGDIFTQQVYIRFRKVFHPDIGVNTSGSKNLLGAGGANAKDILNAYFHTLVAGKVNTFNSRHNLLSLSLFVFWILADNEQPAVAFNHFAFRAALANGW